MKMIPIDSRAIAKVGYDSRRKLLRLLYRNGRLYDYFHVPPEIHGLWNADSAGEFVNRVIKPNYEYSEVEPAR